MAPISPRPRPFAERPSGPLAAKPANDNVLGSWESGVFRFNSPEARDTWKRRSYEQGVGEDSWHLGKEIDPQSAGLMTAGFGGANPGLYQGPDGKYRLMNATTIESQEARDHRNKYLTGKTMDQVASANAMPGADEWVGKGRVAQVGSTEKIANDNRSLSKAPSKQLETATPYGGRFAAMQNKPQEPALAVERPSLGDRFEASATRAFIDNTAFGVSLQAFKSGHARSPDVLATRPPDRFLQSGSKGAADWYRMYEPLGIAGGKRRIDLLSPDERKQWQTEWEALSVEEQAAYRLMWEEKQREFLPWRSQIDREIYLPSPETKAEHAADFLGGLAGSMASPENWIGMEMGAAAGTLRSRTLLTVDDALAAARNVDNLAGGIRETTTDLANSPSLSKLDELTEGTTSDSLVLDSASNKTASTFAEITPKLKADLEIAKKKFYTLREAYNLPEPHLGIIYVREKAPAGAKWVEFMKGHPDVIWLPDTQEFAVPAIRYVNPNTNGKHLIRLDAGGLLGDLGTAALTDTKTQLAVWAKANVRATLFRLREALRQNPGYGKVIYEVETEAAGKKARDFIEKNFFTDIVVVKVRGQ